MALADDGLPRHDRTTLHDSHERVCMQLPRGVQPWLRREVPRSILPLRPDAEGSSPGREPRTEIGSAEPSLSAACAPLFMKRTNHE